MDTTDTVRVLHTMIEYFEIGNKESDASAKAIIEADFESADYWQERVDQLRAGAGWTGLRAIEAELLLSALRIAKANLEIKG